MNNKLSTAAINILNTIDAVQIDKMALATNMKPNALTKYKLLTGRPKRDEGVKAILKSFLISENDTYRVRLQQNGGFSITMVGTYFEFISNIKRSRRQQQILKNGALCVLPENEKPMFLEIWEEIFENNTHRYFIAKDNGTLYLRASNFGCVYEYENRGYTYKALFEVILSSIDFVHKIRTFGQRLMVINESVSSLGYNISDIPSTVTYVAADEIERQLRNY